MLLFRRLAASNVKLLANPRYDKAVDISVPDNLVAIIENDAANTDSPKLRKIVTSIYDCVADVVNSDDLSACEEMMLDAVFDYGRNSWALVFGQCYLSFEGVNPSKHTILSLSIILNNKIFTMVINREYTSLIHKKLAKKQEIRVSRCYKLSCNGFSPGFCQPSGETYQQTKHKTGYSAPPMGQLATCDAPHARSWHGSASTL